MANVDFAAQICEDGEYRLCIYVTDHSTRFSMLIDVPENVSEGMAIADVWYEGFIKGFSAVQSLRHSKKAVEGTFSNESKE